MICCRIPCFAIVAIDIGGQLVDLSGTWSDIDCAMACSLSCIIGNGAVGIFNINHAMCMFVGAGKLYLFGMCYL